MSLNPLHMLPLQITTNDMLTLIEQSSNQLHEKIANAWLFGKIEYTYFEGVASGRGWG